MKRLIISIALALLFSAAAGTVLAQPTFSVTRSSGPAGSGTPVVVNMNWASDSVVVVADLRVTYDSSQLSVTPNCTGNPRWQCSDNGSGTVTVLGFDGNSVLPTEGVGTLSFDISGAAEGAYDLIVGNIEYGNAAAQVVTPDQTADDNGEITVLGAAYSSSPTPATGVVLGSVVQNAADLVANVSISNIGASGTTLSGTCTETSDPDAVFSLSGDTGFSVLQGASADVVSVTCDSAGSLGAHTGEMTCGHNGGSPGEADPAVYALSCTINLGPQPDYNSNPAIGAPLNFAMTEEGDADPQVIVTINNSGDPNTQLDVTCTDSVDPDGVFSVSGGGITNLLPGSNAVVTVTCDASAQGNYTGTLSCDHNGSTAADPATYPLSCVIGPPGQALFDSNPDPDTITDMTPGDDPAEGDPNPTSTLTFFNNADPGDSDVNLACSKSGSTEISVLPDISGGILIAPQGQSAVTFTCDATTAGDYSATYACTYTVDDSALPTGGSTVFNADYTYNCNVRVAESDVETTPASGTTIEKLVQPGGSADFEVVFSEVMDEGVDGQLTACSLDSNTDFSILSPAFPIDISADAPVTVLVQGTDPGDVESVTDTLSCTYEDSENPEGILVTYNLVLLIGGNTSFQVNKAFTDGNPASVEVSISCNTGLPLDQSKVISSSDGVIFIVGDFDSGEMDCTISEPGENGYSATYDSTGSDSASVDDETGCHFTAIAGGDENFCQIVNSPDAVDIDIEKVWVIDGLNDDGLDTSYQLTLYCHAEIVGGGPLCIGPPGPGAQSANSDPVFCQVFNGEGNGSFNAQVIPDYPTSDCWVVENVMDNAVEVDNGCGSLEISAGQGDSCTITNTVFFEGIPTLSQYGMALLALLMLGVGLVGFRRYS